MANVNAFQVAPASSGAQATIEGYAGAPAAAWAEAGVQVYAVAPAPGSLGQVCLPGQGNVLRDVPYLVRRAVRRGA